MAITSGTNVIARHPRHWGKEHTTFDPIHYLALLERKPGAIDFARPLENWGLPECFATLAPTPRSRLRSQGHPRVHQGAAPLGERHAARADQAVEPAITIGATGSDAIALILMHHAEQPVGLFSLDGHPHLKSVAIEPPDLTAYRP